MGLLLWGILWLLQVTGGTLGYWGVLGVLGSNSGYWWILWGTKGYLGVLCRYCSYCGVMWVTMRYCRYWGYWVVLGIKKESCGVLHGTAGYHRVLGGTGVHWGGALVGTEGTGGFWGYSVVPEGALENYWVLGLLGHTGGYMGVLRRIRGYCVVGGIVVYSWVLLGSTGYWGCTCGY